jgi:hypothetical protein
MTPSHHARQARTRTAVAHDDVVTNNPTQKEANLLPTADKKCEIKLVILYQYEMHNDRKICMCCVNKKLGRET